jgi:hypothetical protein
VPGDGAHGRRGIWRADIVTPTERVRQPPTFHFIS